MRKYLCFSESCRIFASEKETNNKLAPKTRKGREIMKTTANNTEAKKMTLDEEMAMWEARANDEFGQTLKEINEKAFNEWFNEDDENGISSTPISHHITAYALDGNRKHTANVIRNIIEDYDMMEDVKDLVKKMMKLAA